MQHDAGAEHLGALDLHERRVGRHHDGGVDAEPGGVPGHGLGVVPGRHGDDPAAPLVLGERQELVEGAALLEGGGELEVLELHDDAGAEDLRERVRPSARGALHGAGDALGGGADVVDGDGRARSRVQAPTTSAPPAASARGRRPCRARSGTATRPSTGRRGSARSGSKRPRGSRSGGSARWGRAATARLAARPDAGLEHPAHPHRHARAPRSDRAPRGPRSSRRPGRA